MTPQAIAAGADGQCVHILIDSTGLRIHDGQRVEVQLASKGLNTMTLLGMTDSYKMG